MHHYSISSPVFYASITSSSRSRRLAEILPPEEATPAVVQDPDAAEVAEIDDPGDDNPQPAVPVDLVSSPSTVKNYCIRLDTVNLSLNIICLKCF